MGFRQDDYEEKLAALASHFPLTLTDFASRYGEPNEQDPETVAAAHADLAVTWASWVLKFAEGSAEREARNRGL